MQTALQQFQALFVAWQQPESRRYYPVARLMAGVGDAHDLYEFAYIKGAQEAAKAGFEPFLAFEDLREVYRSKELFPFFSNRLMSPGRPDYAQYIQSLGLDVNAEPMAILSRSGGTRATDSIELFPLPVRTADGNATPTFFWMHGFRYLDAAQQQRILSLQAGEELSASSNGNNPVDPGAIQLLTTDQVMVGYLPRYLAGEVSQYPRHGVEFHVYVERVNPPPAPTQQRLLCRLVAVLPGDFQPFASETYQPIAADATELVE